MKLIKFIFEDIGQIKLKRKLISNYVNEIILHENFEMGNISVVLCSDNYLLEINRKFLNHDYFTDIITFNYNEKNKISGDLLISLDRIKENALKYNKSIENELYRVIFHGILHLVGYDDKNEISEKQMREKEDFYLKMTMNNE